MPNTSGTYDFLSIECNTLITEAFERIGISGNLIVPNQLDSARRSINFLLTEWVSKSINLWTLQTAFLPLAVGQSVYTLPAYTNDIIQVNLRTSDRELSGTSSSNAITNEGLAKGGIGSNVFIATPTNPPATCTQGASNGNITYYYAVGIRQLGGVGEDSEDSDEVNNVFSQNASLSYTQENTNGWIGYDFADLSPSINAIGIQSLITVDYTLTIEYSNNNVDWFPLIPNKIVPCGVGEVKWLSIPQENVVNARLYRIRETAGKTLSLIQLYFNVGSSLALGNNAVTQEITFIGIQSNVTSTYTLTIEYSLDSNNWLPLFNIPAQSYVANIPVYFDVNNSIAAQGLRIRETGGKTLDIQQLFFNDQVQDFVISAVSRSEYLTYPLPDQQGRPSIYYFNRQIIPTITIWPTPTPQYNTLYYSYTQMMQDVGTYTNKLQIPPTFYQALVWGLAWILSVKYAPDRAQMLKAEYEQAFSTASSADTERLPMRIYGDYSGSSNGYTL